MPRIQNIAARLLPRREVVVAPNMVVVRSRRGVDHVHTEESRFELVRKAEERGDRVHLSAKPLSSPDMVHPSVTVDTVIAGTRNRVIVKKGETVSPEELAALTKEIEEWSTPQTRAVLSPTGLALTNLQENGSSPFNVFHDGITAAEAANIAFAAGIELHVTNRHISLGDPAELAQIISDGTNIATHWG